MSKFQYGDQVKVFGAKEGSVTFCGDSTLYLVQFDSGEHGWFNEQSLELIVPPLKVGDRIEGRREDTLPFWSVLEDPWAPGLLYVKTERGWTNRINGAVVSWSYLTPRSSRLRVLRVGGPKKD